MLQINYTKIIILLLIVTTIAVFISFNSLVTAQSTTYRLTQTLGEGAIVGTAWSNDGTHIAITTQTKLLLFRANDLQNKVNEVQLPQNYDANIVLWSPDDSRIFISSLFLRSVQSKVYDANTLSEITTIPLVGEADFSGPTISPSWDSESTRVAIPDGHDVSVWDTNTGIELQRLVNHNANVNVAAWSPSGIYLVSLDTNAILNIWNASNWTVISSLDLKQFELDETYTLLSSSVAWNDASTAFVFNIRNQLWRYDLSSELVEPILDNPIPSNVFLTNLDWNNSYIAARGSDKRIWVWDESGNMMYESESFLPIPEYALSTSEQSILILVDVIASVVDFSSGNTLQTSNQFMRDIGSLSWSPDGIKLASQVLLSPVQVWSVQSQSVIRLQNVAQNGTAITWGPLVEDVVYATSFPSALYITNSTLSNTTEFWRSQEPDTLDTVIEAIDWHDNTNEQYIVAGQRNGNVIVFDGTTFTELASFLTDDSAVFDVDICGSQIAVVTRAEILHVWDIATQTMQVSLLGYAQFSQWRPDCTAIATMTASDEVVLLNPDTTMAEPMNVSVMAGFSDVEWQNNSVLIIRNDAEVMFWDVISKTMINNISVGSLIVDIAWDPVNSRLAVATADNIIEIWANLSPPTAPSSLNIPSQFSNEITLEWTDSQPDVDGYILERSTDGGTNWESTATIVPETPRYDVSGNTHTYTDVGLTCGENYTYRVKAFLDTEPRMESEYAASVTSNSIPCGPPAPTNLTVTVDQDEYTLTWTDNITDETAFHIERAPDDGTGNPGTFAEIGTVPADTTTFTDTESLACGTYYYRVRAFRADDSLFSDYSNVASIAVQCVPTQPSNLISSPDVELVLLTWDDTTVDETNFRIERSLDGNSWSEIAIATAVVDYTVDAFYFDDDVDCGVTYQYRVRGYRQSDDTYGNYSSVVSAIPLCQEAGPSNFIPSLEMFWSRNFVWGVARS